MRLIDADAMCADLATVDPQYETMIEWCIRVTVAQPTVDAVEVVRCKDCKYCSVDRHADGNVPNYVCIEMDCGVEADGFCSWGERKDDK